jgi:hypothetical protein
LRLHGEGTGEGYPLPLPTRELGWIAIPVILKLHQVKLSTDIENCTTSDTEK